MHSYSNAYINKTGLAGLPIFSILVRHVGVVVGRGDAVVVDEEEQGGDRDRKEGDHLLGQPVVHQGEDVVRALVPARRAGPTQ